MIYVIAFLAVVATLHGLLRLWIWYKEDVEQETVVDDSWIESQRVLDEKLRRFRADAMRREFEWAERCGRAERERRERVRFREQMARRKAHRLRVSI